MSKANSASSNNSATSSETSETHSVEENAQAVGGSALAQHFESNSRIPKSWKRMKEAASAGASDKDGESKRPPWRAVSVSTLPKPDKNALLRAKLLDASRRLRAGKSSIGIQTDMLPTKLMKDSNLGTQTDLILYKEAGVLTDGSYAKKTEGGDEFVLTYSVSQMTDKIPVSSVSTQTLLPKLAADDFMEAYFACERNTKHINKFSETERKLLQQICQIRDENYLATFKKSGASAIATNEEHNTPTIGKHWSDSDARPSLLKPTLSAWHFEYGEIGSETTKNGFMPYTVQPRRPWCSFVPMLPAINRSMDLGNLEYNWNLLLLSIDELIQESNRLADLVEDITTTKRFDYDNVVMQSVQETSDCRLETLTFPSEHWLPIIEEQEKELASMLKSCEELKRAQHIERGNS